MLIAYANNHIQSQNHTFFHDLITHTTQTHWHTPVSSLVPLITLKHESV